MQANRVRLWRPSNANGHDGEFLVDEVVAERVSKQFGAAPGDIEVLVNYKSTGYNDTAWVALAECPETPLRLFNDRQRRKRRADRGWEQLDNGASAGAGGHLPAAASSAAAVSSEVLTPRSAAAAATANEAALLLGLGL